MLKPMDNIRHEWEGLKKVKNRLQLEFEEWKGFEEKVTEIFYRLKKDLEWDAELQIQDKLPELREVRMSINHIFPLHDELVAYNNSATLVFEQRLSGQVLIWHLFPQKEHFTRLEGLQARQAGQFKVDQLLQDENLILFRVETFLTELKGWMLEVLPEPVEEKTAQEF